MPAIAMVIEGCRTRAIRWRARRRRGASRVTSRQQKGGKAGDEQLTEGQFAKGYFVRGACFLPDLTSTHLPSARKFEAAFPK
jgi:hypothetical protein